MAKKKFAGFAEGDEVIVTKVDSLFDAGARLEYVGLKAYVRQAPALINRIGIEFQTNIPRGHFLSGRLKQPRGRYVMPSEIELVEPPPSSPSIMTTLAEPEKLGGYTVLPTDPTARKSVPLGTGVLDYFPAALAEVARVSKAGNDQHNPGQPLHWARGKSQDQADTIIRHFLERGGIDADGQRHSAKMAWRALALLQIEMENEGAPLSRGSK